MRRSLKLFLVLMVLVATASAKEPRVEIFFNTECGHCRHLMPHLLGLWLDYGDELQWTARAIFESEGTDPTGYLTAGGYPFLLVGHGDDLATSLAIQTTPEVVVYDHRGDIHYRLSEDLAATRRAVDGLDLSGKAELNHLAAHWTHAIRHAVEAVIAVRGD